jgi:SAM-dependent methyltransferase
MQISKLKSEAWLTKTSADVYHASTTNAPHLFQLIREELYVRYISRHVSPSSRILDLGAGSGLISCILHDAGHRVVACDISPGMLEKLAEVRGERRFEIRQGSGFQIPAADNEFDLVVSRMFMQHFPDWPAILREQARVIGHGGKIIFDFSNREHVGAANGDGSIDLDYFPYSTDPTIVNKFYAVASEAEMTRHADDCGLKVREIVPFGFLLYNLFIWKGLGSAQGVSEFNSRLEDILARPDARELLLFLEEQAMKYFPKTVSYGNLIVLEKPMRETKRMENYSGLLAAAKKLFFRK